MIIGQTQVESPQPTETRPPTIVVPQLPIETVRERAGNAFDAALNYLLDHTLHQSPSSSDIRRLTELVNERGDLDSGLRAFMLENPDSLITKYYALSGSVTDWLLVERGGRTQVGFNRELFEQDVTIYFADVRADFITACVNAYPPQTQQTTSSGEQVMPTEQQPVNFALVAGLPFNVAGVLEEQLAEQIGGRRNALPFVVGYVSEERLLYVASTTIPQGDLTFQPKTK